MSGRIFHSVCLERGGFSIEAPLVYVASSVQQKAKRTWLNCLV